MSLVFNAAFPVIRVIRTQNSMDMYFRVLELKIPLILKKSIRKNDTYKKHNITSINPIITGLKVLKLILITTFKI